MKKPVNELSLEKENLNLRFIRNELEKRKDFIFLFYTFISLLL